MRQMPTFISELRRRNVIRVATTYALVAWIIIEAGSVLLPTFGAPEGAFQIYVIAVIGGFFLSLILAWVLEITPDGVKLEKDLERSPRRSSAETRQRMNFVIIGLLILALTVSITFNVTGVRNSTELSAATASGNWIAVLPFTDISDSQDNSSLVDGIHNDLLTTLASNKSLKVISQTSVMRYRGKTNSIRQIGEELNVDTILEGTVQRAGDTVRINMQLIDARTDEHLWAKIYDRNLTMQNIFEIQKDISTSIARELRAALTPDVVSRPTRIPTDNLVAFNLYSKATSDMALRQLPNALAARSQFEKAIELDPDFAEAHAGLATSVLLLYINDKAIERDEAFALAERELDLALALNPELADAYAAKGLLDLQIWQETRLGDANVKAADAFNKALELNPNHAYAYMWFASLRASEGLTDQAIELYEKSKEVDPLGRIPYANLPNLYAEKGQYEKALRLLVQATELHPDWPTPYQVIATQLASLGRLDESLAWMNRARQLSNEYIESGNLDIGIYMAFGDYDRAKQIMQSIPAANPMAIFTEGISLLIDRDIDAALEVLMAKLQEKPDQPPYMYDFVSSVALLAGNLDIAEEFTLRGNPLLTSDSELVVDKYTLGSAMQLAYIAKQRGNVKKSRKLLNDALAFVQGQAHFGTNGIGITDVQIYALLGRVEDAISAFREAVADGFRSSLMQDLWPIEDDPYLASIRDDKRFVAILSRVNADLDRMRDNTMEAESSGNWDILTQIVIQAAKSDAVAGLKSAISR
jgi:TolB-like protein/tetratricopeptide (TPR) repeat protein